MRAFLSPAEAHFRKVLTYAPGMLGNDAVNFFLDRFRQQAWLGYTTENWAARKQKSKRALLVRSGYLRRSVRITRINGLTTFIGSDAVYAKAHNEGFKGVVHVKQHTRNKYRNEKIATGKFTRKGKMRMRTVQRVNGSINVKAHTRRMNLPRRQFMGYSPVLEKQLQRRLMAELLKGLR
jgi:phage gpG-like protein